MSLTEETKELAAQATREVEDKIFNQLYGGELKHLPITALLDIWFSLHKLMSHNEDKLDKKPLKINLCTHLEEYFICTQCQKPFKGVKYIGREKRGVSPCCYSYFRKNK